MLGSRDELLALKPDFATLDAAGHRRRRAAAGRAATRQFEMRAFIGGAGPNEDPVTGSLQAGLAQWLIGARLRAASATSRFKARRSGATAASTSSSAARTFGSAATA